MAYLIAVTSGLMKRPWISGFLLQQLLSTIGAMLAGVLAAAVLALVTAAVTKNNSGGNWIDHVVAQSELRATGRTTFRVSHSGWRSIRCPKLAQGLEVICNVGMAVARNKSCVQHFHLENWRLSSALD